MIWILVMNWRIKMVDTNTVTNIECRICKQIESHNKDSFLALKDSKYWSVLVRNTAELYVNDSQIGDDEGRKVFAEGIYHGSNPYGKFSIMMLKTNEMRKYAQLEELLELPLSKAINKLKALKKEYK